MTGHAGALSGGHAANEVWSAVGASAWLRRPIAARAGIYGGLEAIVATTRPRFALDDGTSLHGAGPAAMRAVIGIDLQMP